jgi:hypothetical protein
MERLIREVGDAVGERLRLGEQSVDDVARELHEKVSVCVALDTSRIFR